MSEVSPGILRWLVDLYLLASVLLLSACLANCLVRQPSGRLVLVWSSLLGVVFLAVAPLLPFWPRENLRVIEIASLPEPPSVMMPPARRDAPADNRAEEPGQFSAATATADDHLPAHHSQVTKKKLNDDSKGAHPSLAVIPQDARLLVVVFAAAQLGVVIWLAVGWLYVRRLVQRSRLAPANLMKLFRQVVPANRHAPSLLISQELDQPVAVGLLAPRIIIPEHLLTADATALQAVLRHEATHVRRRDLWLLAIFRWLAPLLFAHPCYWWLRRQARIDQELLADAAASDSQSRVAYAEMLVAWAGRRRFWAVGGLAASMLGRGTLKRRIAVLLDPQARVDAAACPRWKAASSALCAVTVVALSGITLCGAAKNFDGVSSSHQPADGATAQPKAVQPASPLRSPAAEQLVAYLTDDVSLEVIGVRQHPCIGSGWWNPNGAGYAGAVSSDPTQPLMGPEIVVRVHNPRKLPLDWRLGDGLVQTLDADAAPPRAGAESGRLLAISLPTPTSVADFCLRVGVGPWRMHNSSGCALDGASGQFRYSTCNESNGAVVVSVTYPKNDDELQVVAVDLAGREHLPRDVTSAAGELTATFDGLSIGEIQEFCVQTRLERRVQFRNISFVPGQLTDAQLVASQAEVPGV